MPMDFTVILPIRQRFGSEPSRELFHELEAPWAGFTAVYNFSCPGVDRSQAAVLQLESLGLTGDSPTTRNHILINWVPIPGGLKTGGNWYELGEIWRNHSLIVPPNTLSEMNFLWIISSPIYTGGPRDDFIIDNVVILYKTRQATGAFPGSTLAAFS